MAEADRSIWVWRLATPQDWAWDDSPQPRAAHGEARIFEVRELFQNNCLRQGWGTFGHDIRQPYDVWFRNVVPQALGSPRVPGQQITPEKVPERYRIRCLMVDMRPGDAIFVPSVSRTVLPIDRSSFTVVMVDAPYDFEDRRQIIGPLWQQDFSHFMMVRCLWTFPTTALNVPLWYWRKAVNRVQDPRLRRFLQENYW
jgi:hypothetical protein